MGYRRFEPSQSFSDHVDQQLGDFVAAIKAKGYTPDQVSMNLNLTLRSNAEVELARERAIAAGIGQVIIVDDSLPPRPGTVHSSTLDPMQSSVAAEARASRILGER